MANTQDHIGLSPFEKLKRLADQIRPGIYRSQVERIFPRSNGGIQGPCITIFNEIPGGRIEIPFDRIGGEMGHSENRVAGAARIFVTVP